MSADYGVVSIANYPVSSINFVDRINRSIASDSDDVNTSASQVTEAPTSLKQETNKLTAKSQEELTRQEQAKVQQLKRRDLEVKAHEQAHLNAAGSIAVSGARFTYTTGPNGVRYATGGEVSIDTSEVVNDPAATIRKADIIRRAALAPMNPSPQDYNVASQANDMAAQARSELIQEQSLSPNENSQRSDDSEADTDSSNTENNETTNDSQPVENTQTLKVPLDINI